MEVTWYTGYFGLISFLLELYKRLLAVPIGLAAVPTNAINAEQLS